MLMGRGEQCSKQSATVVLASLSHSAREVFKLIAGAQLDPLGEQGESGLGWQPACPPACRATACLPGALAPTACLPAHNYLC
jgi:hypothetical protein